MEGEALAGKKDSASTGKGGRDWGEDVYKVFSGVCFEPNPGK